MILKIHQLICAKVKCWACKSSHSIRRVEHTKKSPQTNFTIVNALKRFNFWNHVSKSLWLNLISIQAHNDILCAVFSICDLIYGTVNGYLDVCKCFGYNKSELYISDVVNNIAGIFPREIETNSFLFSVCFCMSDAFYARMYVCAMKWKLENFSCSVAFAISVGRNHWNGWEKLLKS